MEDRREEVDITARWHGGEEIPAHGVAAFGHARGQEGGAGARDHLRLVKEHATQGRVGVENRNQGRPMPPPTSTTRRMPEKSAAAATAACRCSGASAIY